MNRGKISFAKRTFFAAFAVALGLALLSEGHAQKLGTDANPPSGLAGVNSSTIEGTGFPSGTITGATVSFASSCGGTVLATTPTTSVTTEGAIREFGFAIPSSLKTGSYYVTVAGTAGTTAFNTASVPSCSQIQVTATSTTLAACVPTSSLAVTAGTNVDVFIPNGSWDYGTTGVFRVPLEGTDPPLTFTTPGTVNSCAANSVTGEVVCTENTTNVDLINGSKLTTITDGANRYVSFTGGDCESCGVAINASNNTAVIAGGFTGGTDGYGVQTLNLATNTFLPASPIDSEISEDISIDSSRNLLLSPGENGTYDLLQIGSGGSFTEYENYVAGLGGGGTLDSAAEDCTTGIAMSASEFTDYIYITDLTQTKFTAGTPGTWTAPMQIVDVGNPAYASFAIDGDSFSAGTSGISVAPGTNHLGVVTGEFGGSSYSVLQLPSTSGSGTPTIVDYAYVTSMPNTPDGKAFGSGSDPHTVTAYTSPNTSKSYAVFADWGSGYGSAPPTYVARVDLACVLALARASDGHTVSASTAPCTTYVAIP
ncbi:MAG: hypothetical protein WAK26_05855 [Terracidiphilus sp.]